MTLSRPRLVLLPGDPALDAAQIEALKTQFDVVLVEDAGEIERLIAEQPDSLIAGRLESIGTLRVPASAAATVLSHIGEGVGVVDAEQSITWQNARLAEFGDDVRTRFAELCKRAIDLFNQESTVADAAGRRSSRKFTFRTDDHHYELVASPAPADDGPIKAVVGVLWDVTAGRRMLDKLDAIDAAGSELMKIEADSIKNLSMAERLTLLEEKIVNYVHDLLHFDEFEIRLVDPETNRLDLVTAVGITPLRIGEVIYAEPEGNGISGYVAATGDSYLCPSVRDDPRYREGLDDAASSLTVPLRLHDRTIGVFNIESKTPGAFDENDRQFATIFARYIAMAMNILNLLVVERFTTNEQLAENVLSELSDPLAEITEHAEALQDESLGEQEIRAELRHIIDAAAKIRRRVESVMAGPRTLLGAEEELHRDKPDPEMIGKRILVADDEAEIRTTVSAILAQRGCDVTVCADGRQTIETLHRCREGAPPFDLVISDIKMPDRSGYEVFRATKEISAETPVILMTGFGYDPHHCIVRASQEGLQSFLFKPFKAKQLIDEVKKALALRQKQST